RRTGKLEPAIDVRRALRRIVECADRAAVRVTADDDLVHLEDLDRELDRRRRAVEAPVILEGRDERAHVADMKQLAWTSACEHLRHYARVGAADEECRRLLARVDEVPVMFAVLREDLAPEAAQSFDEFVRHPGRIGGVARSGQAAR